tara:strand:+ start:328 stop:2454 length:2127 start_codon:yes stop_codon:yes gene_type:complete
MTILRTDKVAGPGGRNAIDGSVHFGGYVDGVASDYLKIPDSDDLDMGTEDFTFECWARGVEHTGSGDRAMGIFSSGAFTAGGLLIQNKNNGPLRVVIPLAAGGNFDESGSTNLWYGNWHHIAVVKTSNTIKAFINGVQEISATHSVGVDFAHGGYATVGENCYVTYPGDYPYRGYISNLRLIKGSALYTSNFIPPTEKLKAIDGTVLLCCQDSDDPTQEATGKTITGVGGLASVGVNENLVTNGYFTTGTTGWDDSLAPSETTLTSENQRLKIVASGGTGRARQEVTGLTIGNRYKFQVRHVTCDSGNCFTHLGTSSGGAEYVANLGIGDEDLHTFYFTATATSAWIQIGITIGLTGYFDDVSITLAESPKAPKVLPPVGVDAGTVLEGDITFDSLNYMTLPRGTTTQSNRGRGTFSGGYTSPNNANLNSIDYVQIQSLGNSIDFGDLTQARYGGGSGASSTRGLQMGGRVGSTRVKTIDYITFATTSNATTFGELTVINAYVHGASNNTRALNMGGATPAYTSLINYVTIASTGDGQEFGDLTDARGGAPAVASPTRACCVSGHDGSSYVTVIDYVEIASQGVDASTFGDVSSGFAYGAGLSSNTRGIVGGGTRGSGEINDIVYITIASKGDATDFGDLYKAREHTSATSNSIRGVFGGGVTPTYYNNIQYVTISTTGNSVDFGDFIVDARKAYSMTTSDSHGGLSQ